MSRLRFLLSVGSLAAVAVASPSFAQQAGIEVTLVDAASGKPLANVAVTVTNPEIGLSRTASSDANGLVRLDGLTTAGTYRVSTAATQDFAASEPADLVLRSNFTRSVTLRLRPKSAETIVVTATRITGLNTVNAEVSASLRKEELDALPIEGRDVIGALIRLPNVVPSTGFFPEAPVV